MESYQFVQLENAAAERILMAGDASREAASGAAPGGRGRAGVRPQTVPPTERTSLLDASSLCLRFGETSEESCGSVIIRGRERRERREDKNVKKK